MIAGLPRTWVGWLNFVLLQWFCWRLAQVIDVSTGRRLRFAWVGPVRPLSGWWSDYVWLFAPRRRRRD